MIRRRCPAPGRSVAESCPRPPAVRGREGPLLGWGSSPERHLRGVDPHRGQARDHLGPRPDPDPARGAPRPGQPARLPPRARLREHHARGHRPAAHALSHRDGRRAADDLERHRRTRVGDRELLLAGRRGAGAGGGVLRRAVQGARRDLRAHRAHGRLRVGRAHPPRRGRGRAGRAPREGRAAHPVGDLHRRDPADRTAREGRQRRRRDGRRRRRCPRSAPCRSSSTRGASTSRWAARRRPSAPRPASRSSRSASAPGKPRAPPRTPASTSTGPRTSASPTCRTPRTPGLRRSA